MTEEWMQTRDWLVAAGALPADAEAAQPDATVVQFAFALQDGFVLGTLLNRLVAGAIATLHEAPTLQFLCYENITNFVEGCTKHLGVKQTDLFEPDELFYATNFEKVLIALWRVSESKPAISFGLPPIVHRDAKVRAAVAEEESLYGNLSSLLERSLSARQDNYAHLRADEVYGNADEFYDSVVKIQGVVEAPTPVPPGVDKRSFVLSELVDTERNYCEDLRLLCDVFQPAVSRLSFVAPEDVATLFSNVGELRDMHVQMLAGMDAALMQNDRVSAVFLQAADGLLRYGQYCANIPDAVAKVHQLMDDIKSPYTEQQQREFNAAHREARKAAKTGFALNDLVSVPMQRILKYPLLLKELIKYTPVKHADFQGLANSLTAIKDVAAHINEAKRDRDNMRMTESLQQRIDEYEGLPLSSYGKLLKDGDMRVRLPSENKVKPRYLFLFETAFLVCQPKGNRYLHKETIGFAGSSIEDVPYVHGEEVHAWALRTPQGACSLYAKNADAKAKWMTAFRSAVTSNVPDAQLRIEVTGDVALTRPHTYKLTTYTKPTFCYFCHSLLWGIINQGFKCQQCGIDSHKKCIALITGNCGDIAAHKGSIVGGSPLMLRQNSSQLLSDEEALRKTISAKLSQLASAPASSQGLPSSSASAAAGQPTLGRTSSVARLDEPPLPPGIGQARASGAPAGAAAAMAGDVGLGVCVALYAYDGGRDDELRFFKGDEIALMDNKDPVWWKGELRGIVGLFPSSYVEHIRPEQTVQSRRPLPVIPAAGSVRGAPQPPQATPAMNSAPAMHHQGHQARHSQGPAHIALASHAYPSLSSSGSHQHQHQQPLPQPQPQQPQPQPQQPQPQAHVPPRGSVACPTLPPSEPPFTNDDEYLTPDDVTRLRGSVDWKTRVYFHGRISRGEAEARLYPEGVGCFLVRESETRMGEYSLSLRSTQAVKHIRIGNKDGSFCLAETRLFPSVPDLIACYCAESLAQHFKDLHFSLTAPCTRPSESAAPSPGATAVGRPRMKMARAEYAFHGQNPDELSFPEGAELTVIEKFADGWWRGEIGGRRGVFPGSYVCEL